MRRLYKLLNVLLLTVSLFGCEKEVREPITITDVYDSFEISYLDYIDNVSNDLSFEYQIKNNTDHPIAIASDTGSFTKFPFSILDINGNTLGELEFALDAKIPSGPFEIIEAGEFVTFQVVNTEWLEIAEMISGKDLKKDKYIYRTGTFIQLSSIEELMEVDGEHYQKVIEYDTGETYIGELEYEHFLIGFEFNYTGE